MKKFIAWILVLVLCLGVFAGCTENPKESTPAGTTAGAAENEGLTKAAKYLKALYKDSPEKTSADYERTSVVPVGKVKYTVTWSVDVSEDLVKIVPGETTTLIDVKDENDTETPYVLTATVSDDKGNTKTVTFNHILPVSFGDNMGAIVDAAYELESGAKMDAPVTLTGEIIRIDTPWDAGYKNITVTIEIEGKEDKPIMCYRLAGEGADALKIGDTITVTGTIKNYNGTIEFDAGCALDKVVPGETVEAITDPDQLLDAAYALEAGKALPFDGTLTGVITSVDTVYSADYKNVTVTIVVNGKTDKPVQCFRLKGEGADLIAVGDTITVTGGLMNYNGKVQFGAGCTLDAYTKAEGGNTTEPPATEPPATEPPVTEAPAPVLDTPEKIVNAAYALEKDATLDGEYTLTGVIITVDTAFSSQYNNITVTIQVGDMADKPIMCFRLKGEGADQITVGDTITVTGTLKNYNGTIEFTPCTLDSFVKGENETPVAPEDPKEIVDAAYALEAGAALPYEATLTGTITEIGTPYSADYKNITVTIAVAGKEDKPIVCFRLKGEGAENLKVGDTITVTGTLKNYNGTIEFDSGCTFVMATAGTNAVANVARARGNGAPVVASEEPEAPVVVDAPVAGTAYFFGMVHGGVSETDVYYITGAMDGYYMATSKDPAKAAVVYLEETEGGHYLYTMVEDAKVYINMVADGSYVNGKYEAAASTVYTFDAETKTLVATINENTYRFGTRSDKTYTTVGPVKTTAENYFCQIYTVVEVEEPENTDPAADSVLTIPEAIALGNTKDKNEYTEGKYYVTGVIKEVQNATYGNILIADEEGNEILVYGTYDADGTNRYDAMEVKPEVGDTITVYGVIGRYNAPQLKNAWITAHTPAEKEEEEEEEEEVPAPTTPAEIVDAAYALEAGASLEGTYTLTGKVTEIGTPYSEQYKNVTVSIVVEGCEDKPIVCFRLKGEGADTVKVGDTITVTGTLMNYNGTIEFNSGCTLEDLIPATGNFGIIAVTAVMLMSGTALVVLKKKEF